MRSRYAQYRYGPYLRQYWRRPRGYSNGIAARGRMVFLSGMIGWNAQERFESDDFAHQALYNMVAVLREAGRAPSISCA
jgi:enamine deaminase RidA (YjgF/YER057c/UK114 family)